MYKIAKLVAAVAFAATSSVASAALITDTVNPTGVTTINSLTPFVYTHDLTDNTPPYLLGFDSITSASLSIRLQDGGSPNNNLESFTFTLNHDGSVLFAGTDTPNGAFDYNNLLVTSAPLASLGSTGKLSLTISTLSGSFQFLSSTLTANVVNGVTPPTSVPEPFSMTLLGIGLAGIAISRRKG